MMTRTRLVTAVLCGFCLVATHVQPASHARAATVSPAENTAAQRWFARQFDPGAPVLPISFFYDGASSEKFFKRARLTTTVIKELDAHRAQYTFFFRDDATQLVVRCVTVVDREYPVVEWTAYFKNDGRKDTPILRDIQGLDFVFAPEGSGECVLHGVKGDWCNASSYEPYRFALGVGDVRKFAPPARSGKSCDGPNGWPYFNLQMPGGGAIVAVGWPGQWAGSFTRQAAGVHVRAGQELTNLYLKPGEEIRTPLIALLFWQGTDVVRAQNLWRRWYIARVIPRVDGQPQPPVTRVGVGGSVKDIPQFAALLQAGIKPELCWRDAGAGGTTWYPSDRGPYQGKKLAWLNTGTWEVDPTKYPDGFKPFSDWVRARGMKFMLWFEPERVGDPECWLAKNHPDWLLPGTSHGALLNEGHPAARKWLIDHVDGMIRSQGLDWYREDMNGGGPLPAWRKNDAGDRQGITENLYVQGHLEFWDELRRRHPKLCIDSCASGGRRNDLETMRRAVPLLRSDFVELDMPGVVEGNQGHTYGLSFWLPFQGSGSRFLEAYSYRSVYLPCFGIGGPTPTNIELRKKAFAECRQVAPFVLFGDYYPLTPYSLKLDQWIAWQFDRPEQGAGVVQAFRRKDSPVASMTLKLHGLEPAATYTVTDFDGGAVTRSGQQLSAAGLEIRLSSAPGSAVFMYQKH